MLVRLLGLEDSAAEIPSAETSETDESICA